MREFEIIGEAVGRIPDNLKERYPDVEWQDIKDCRNLLAHEYFGVDYEIVWRAVKEDVPQNDSMIVGYAVFRLLKDMIKTNNTPINPGEILPEDFLDPLDISLNKLSRDLSVTSNRMHFYSVCFKEFRNHNFKFADQGL